MKLTASGKLRINFRDFLPGDNRRLQCNFRCSYCNQTNVEQLKFSEKEFNDSKRVWDLLAQLEDKLYVRNNFDGEILVDKVARRISSYICDLENVVSFEIITNNSINPARYLGEFETSKLSFNCSFHPEFISIDRFVQHIEIMRKAGCPVFATMVVTPQLVKQLPDIADIFKYEQILFRPLLLLGQYKTSFLPFPKRIRQKFCEIVLSKTNEYPEAYSKKELQIIRPFYYSEEEFKYQYGKNCKGMPCYAGVDMINVYMEGVVKRCFSGDIGSVEELLTGQKQLKKEAYACHAQKCQCPTHMMFLKEFRDKYPLSDKFADLYLIA